MKAVYRLLISLAAVGVAASSLADISDYTYVTNGMEITITGYDCSAGNEVAVIPDTIDGLPVTSIGYGAFRNCEYLTHVTIPDSVTDIGDLAFHDFDALWTITVTTGNPAYSDLDGVLFNAVMTVLVAYPAGRAGSYSIPTSVTRIATEAFRNSFSLTGATIPANVTIIGARAFLNCGALTSVTIPDNVTRIRAETFLNCFSLTRVTIGSSATTIEDHAFASCSALTHVTVPASVTSIGDQAFQLCDSLASLYFAGDEPSIGDGVFSDSFPTIYYLAGTTGWDLIFAERPTALWALPELTGIVVESLVGDPVTLNISGTPADMTVTVKACTDLANPVWIDVGTATLVDGTNSVTDVDSTHYANRIYCMSPP